MTNMGGSAMNVMQIMIAFVFGTIVGSFLNVCIYRIPEAKSIVFPPSACPNCNNRLKIYHLIPVLSFLFLRGKCHFCQAPISWRYPVVESLTGILYTALFIKYGLSFILIKYLILVSLLIIISLIDLEKMIIPNIISIPGIILGMALSYSDLLNSLLGAVTGFVNYRTGDHP